MMTSHRSGVSRRMGRAYAILGLRALRLVLLVAVIAGLASAIVVPLWLLATRYPRGFTTAGLAVVAVALAAAIGFRTAGAVRDAGSFPQYLRAKLLPALIRLLTAGVFLGVAYWIVVLFAAGVLAVAIPLTALWVAGIGVAMALLGPRGRGPRA